MMIESLASMTVDELVALYADKGIEQYKALDEFDTRTFNRIFRLTRAIEKELESRNGDQRSALLPLYSHRNLQVRLNAAGATAAIAPAAARAALQAIRELKWNPQSMDAGMTLRFWDDGTWQPE